MKISIDIIRDRLSVRTYSGDPLSPGDIETINRAILKAGPCPFATSPRFALINVDRSKPGKLGRVGTYGVIKNAPAFIVGAMSPDPFAFVDYGYALEGIILSATAAGLGTCWFGGIFDRKGVGKMLALAPDEVIPAISPVGRPAGRRTFAERIIRGSAGSTKRKPWNELFFDNVWDRPLPETAAGAWSAILEAVRLGPSASNKQPWRLVRSGNAASPSFHLYLKEDAIYTRAIPGVLLQDLDAGIAMRHFEVAARHESLPGSWLRLDTDPVPGPAPLRYIASWTSAG
ncbi:MAG: nitroreductase [Spirochaetales bacterium]|nr:MAG: nitroreductase [Spirochaetales bacterium]